MANEEILETRVCSHCDREYYHRLDDTEREILCGPCDIAKNGRDAAGVIWKATGGTRAWKPSKYAPGVTGINPGHEDLTLSKLGVKPHQRAKLERELGL